MFAFIPMDFVTDPFGVKYRADGAGFSYERSEYRIRHTLTIDPSIVTPSEHLSGRGGLGSTRVPPGFVITDKRDVGQSVSYLPMISPPTPMRPISFVFNLELERDTADRLTSMTWFFRRAADGSFRITMIADATNPVAVSRFFGVVPAINYEVAFDFAVDRSVTVSGTHDGFPAYDFYYQRRQFYHYDPIAVGASPLSLFGVTPDLPVEMRLR